MKPWALRIGNVKTEGVVNQKTLLIVLTYFSFHPTERHMQRMSRLLQASMFVDFMWQHMRLTDLPEEKEITSIPVTSRPTREDARA